MNTSENKGFTIVETMIFLVVSGVLFISVALLIAGQTAKYQAKDSINQVESIMRGTFNDVGNGYYPLTGDKFDCTPNPGAQPIITVPGSRERGQNTGCIIAGKSIEFRSDDIKIETLVANADIDTVPTPSLFVPITQLDETKDYKWGLKYINNPVSYKNKVYIFYTKFKEETGASEEYISGSQSISAFIYDTSLSPAEMVPIATVKTNNKFCFINGSNKSSLIISDYSLTIEAKYIDSSC